MRLSPEKELFAIDVKAPPALVLEVSTCPSVVVPTIVGGARFWTAMSATVVVADEEDDAEIVEGPDHAPVALVAVTSTRET